MIMHPCTWASNKGRELKLSCPERVTLWQLAERAAAKGFCWPSVVQLMEDTGLARQTVIDTVRSLAQRGLIEIEKVLRGGKLCHNYRVLSPVQNQTADRSKSRPDTGPKSDRKVIPIRSKSEPQTGLKTDNLRSKNTPISGLKSDPNLKRTLKEPEKGAATPRDDAASSAASDGRCGGDAAPLPTMPAKAPTIGGGTTNGSGRPANAMNVPGQRDDPFGDWLDQGAPADGSMHCDVEPDEITEDDRPKTETDRQRMAEAMATQANALEAEFRERANRMRFGGYAPGQRAEFTAEEQIAIVTPPRPLGALRPEQLAALRHAAGYGP